MTAKDEPVVPASKASGRGAPVPSQSAPEQYQAPSAGILGDPSDPPVADTGRQIRWTPIAALVIAVLALALSGYAWYSMAVTGRIEVGRQLSRMESVATASAVLRERQQQLETQQLSTARRADDDRRALAGEIDELEQRLTGKLTDLERAGSRDFEDIQQELAALSAALEKVGYEIGTSVDDWVLEETSQLLLLAGQRLALSADVALARRALELADQKLQAIPAPDILAVRRQLALEMTALDSVPRVDVDGIVLKLSAMAEQVDQLPLKGDLDRPDWAKPGGLTGQRAESGSLETLGKTILDDLGKLVRVRKVDETRPPRLDSAQRFLAFENLRLQLVTAQLSLLRQRPDLFRDSLAKAGSWLGDYFESDPAVAEFAASLEALMARQLSVELPDISGSRKALQDVIAARSNSE